jgi:DNA-binding MurR/RpiR family transcriptional regulator
LHQAEKRTVLVDSVGGMAHQQIHGLCRRDLLIAVSYHPYAEEAVGLIEVASNKACRVLSITDSLVSPVGKPASMVLQVREAEIRKFRSLSSSMCLAQTLVIAYVFVNSQNGKRAAAAGARRGGRRKK